METVRAKSLETLDLAFLNFLRGMETPCRSVPLSLRLCFLNFLRGMETEWGGLTLPELKHFLNFLRGMETTALCLGWWTINILPKLP